VIDRLTCAIVDEHDLVVRFVAGRLSKTEAEALEEHCLTCDRCWTELRLATRVHAAADAGTMQAPAVILHGERSRLGKKRILAWGALAASFATAAIGLRLLSRSGPIEHERGAGATLTVTAARSSDGLTLDWSDVDGAARYVVEVMTTEGELLARREVTRSDVAIRLRAQPDNTHRLTVFVTAYDALGTRLAESPMDSVP
jgi:hypothetical protein